MPVRPLPQWLDSSVIYKVRGGKKETFTFQAQTFDVNGISFKMIRIPNQNYSISQTQVTQALYRAVTGQSLEL